MAPISSIEPLAPAHRAILLNVAEGSVRHGLDTGQPTAIAAGSYPAPLFARRATFVTLELAGQLRGCIGTLVAEKPLVEDVALHAFAAAFRDPRFPPLSAEELPGLAIVVSVLSPAEPLPASSEAELIAGLRAGRDGLILKEGSRRSTFLPSVWESLPDPRAFVTHLKRKAGLPADYWSPTLRFERYVTESFRRDTDGRAA